MPSESAIKVGVIGCGNITLRGHGPALLEVEGVEVVAVADPITARRSEAIELLSLPAEAGYQSHRELLAEAHPDYVVLTVPQSLRRVIIEDCARAGVHVLAEKPIATRPVEGQAFSDLMRAAGLRLGMVHNYLFYPEYRLIRELLEQGAVGAVRHINMNFMGVPDNPGHADYQPLWRHDYQSAGGGILMDMIHVLYLAEYMIGEPIRSVSAAVDNLSQPGGQVEDLALIRLAFSNSYASINLSWGEGPGGIQVSGTEGRILCFYRDYATGPFDVLQEFTVIGAKGMQSYSPRTEPPSVETFAEIQRDFASAVRNGHEPLAPASAGIRSLCAALAVYGSAHQGTVIDLPLEESHPLYQTGLAGLRELAPWSGSPLAAKQLFGLEEEAVLS
jgi:predicted dehydrogenase